jgi:membrane-associated phospholipid phosphatase
MRLRLFFFSLLASNSLHAERLSDWLISQPNAASAYPLGLSWQVPTERIPQTELRYDLLTAVDQQLGLPPLERYQLHRFIDTLPVTGRVPIASADGHWLQVNPRFDPVVQPDDTLVFPVRPRTITLLSEQGEPCQVLHRPGFTPLDYLQQCPGFSQVDEVYVAQPDGQIQRAGVALWNQQRTDEPAPGAWIWAPSRHIPPAFSEKMVAFLATQGPAPDDPDTLPLPPPQLRHSLTNLPVTANDWGEAGLLQMPSARMRPAGDFSFTLSQVSPYTWANIFLQPFDWMEFGFRYTNISNRLYGPASLSGTQTYKDKSVDIKLRLHQESFYLPEVAVGLRDIVGTGLFSGQYLVSSKRTGPFDWTLGMGWGYVGGRADLNNPIGYLFPSFYTRSANNVGQGGTLALNTYFRGPAALFGGVQYQTPWDPLLLKLEYDGNNYQNEPLGNVFPQSSPFNVGLVYRLNDTVDLSAGLERGNTLMMGLTLHSALDKISTPKLDDPPRVAVIPLTQPRAAANWSQTAHDLEEQTHWKVLALGQQGHDLMIRLDEAGDTYWRDYLERAIAVLNRDAPAGIERFIFIYQDKGIEMADHVVDRNAWVTARLQPIPPTQRLPVVVAQAPPLPTATTTTTEPIGTGLPLTSAAENNLFTQIPPGFESQLGLNLTYFFGGPNSFMLYEVAPAETLKYHFNANTWVQGTVQYDVLDNFNTFTYTAPSNLPHVRTDIRQYVTTSRLTIPNLQMTRVGQLSSDQYWSIYGGYLEPMFGGVGGEWLYRPFDSRTAFGIDINDVQQRGFAQNFSFLNYRVVTGHATLYWDTGWQNVLSTLSAGRYLAGDVGATIDFSRIFNNGIRVGAWFTKTNVSAQQFGEGSFDKGVYMAIPFDALLTQSSHTVGSFVWDPLIRDGGAKLERAVALYDITNARNPRTLEFEPGPTPNDQLIPERQHSNWQPVAETAPPTQVNHPTIAQWQQNPEPFQLRLMEALRLAGYQNIRVNLDENHRLTLEVSHDGLRPESRAVGHAARIALAQAPLDAREIRVILDEHLAPVVRYDFFDLSLLRRYFEGNVSAIVLRHSVAIDQINPTVAQADPLDQLDDLQPPRITAGDAFTPDLRFIPRGFSDLAQAAHVAAQTDWTPTVLWGAGLVLSSALLDRSANNFALKHANNRYLIQFDKVGNLLPWLESAGVAAAALGSQDPEVSRTGYAASESVVSSFAAVFVTKFIVGRARPSTGHSYLNFSPFAGSAGKGTNGFPSGHATAAMAALTPFALEYDAPWLYALAGVTNLSRVASRHHWVSDTVAGSLVGFTFGKVFWESSRTKESSGTQVVVTPFGASLAWQF